MKFIYSYTDIKWDLFIGYSHGNKSVVSRRYEWSLFIATLTSNEIFALAIVMVKSFNYNGQWPCDRKYSIETNAKMDASNKRFATTPEEEITAKKLKMCVEKTLKQMKQQLLFWRNTTKVGILTCLTMGKS